MKRIGVCFGLILAFVVSGCGPSLRVTAIRVGALAKAKPAGCAAEIVDMDIAVAMNRLQQVGMLSITGESNLTPEIEKRVRAEACALGGETVVFNAGSNDVGGGGFLQFMVFRARPAGPDHAAPMDLLSQSIAKALGEHGKLPEKPIPAGVVVAILDIEDAGHILKPDSNQALTDALSTFLAEGSTFKVIPSKQTREQLKAQAKESYQANYDDATQVEIGKAAAAQKTLTTKLIKAGDKCALSAVLFDITSQTSESAATVTGGCGMSDLLANLAPLVKKLRG